MACGLYEEHRQEAKAIDFGGSAVGLDEGEATL